MHAICKFSGFSCRNRSNLTTPQIIMSITWRDIQLSFMLIVIYAGELKLVRQSNNFIHAYIFEANNANYSAKILFTFCGRPSLHSLEIDGTHNSIGSYIPVKYYLHHM